MTEEEFDKRYARILETIGHLNIRETLFAMDGQGLMVTALNNEICRLKKKVNGYCRFHGLPLKYKSFSPYLKYSDPYKENS